MKTLTYIPAFFALLLCSCSPKVFQISVEPEGSIVRYNNSYMHTNIGEAGSKGLSYKAIFVGKRDSSYFLAMKRGYTPDSVFVKKGSDLRVAIRLKRNSADSQIRDYSSQLSAALISVLTPEIDVRYHTGVGNIGHYEKSESESAQISADLTNNLKNAYAVKGQRCRIFTGRLFNYRDTTKVPADVIKYLISLDPLLIRYYGVAPSLNKYFIAGYSGSSLNLNPAADINDSFLAVVYCKTIKPTGGRVAGNIIAGSLAAGLPSTSPIYNPEAFNMDNSTLITIYFIHYPSGEIVKIIQRSLQYDIVNEKGRKAAFSVISGMLDQR